MKIKDIISEFRNDFRAAMPVELAEALHDIEATRTPSAEDIKHTIGHNIDGGRAWQDLFYHLPEDALYSLAVAYFTRGNGGLLDAGSAMLDDAVEALVRQYEEEA
jgi:hypothetical protein